MTLKELSRLHGHKAGVTTLAAGFNNRDRLLLSGSDDQTCRVWDTRTNKAVSGIVGFKSEVSGVCFVGDNSLAVACGSTIHIYDQRSTGVVTQAQNMTAKIEQADKDCEIQGISARGDFIAYVDEDGYLSVCDVTDPGNPTRFTGAHDALASCVCFHPEEAIVATGGCDQQVLVWDVASESTVKTFKAWLVETDKKMLNPPFVYALDFAPDESCTVVSGHADGRVMCSNSDGSFSWPECHSYSISAIQFVRSNPDILATAGLDCVVRLWGTDAVLDSSEAPKPIEQHKVTAKPDSLATLENSSMLYVDQDCAIVSFAIQ